MREIQESQVALAKAIGESFHQTDKLVPLGRSGSFSVGTMVHGIWTGERACDLAWWAVASQMQDAMKDKHVIDHAWLAVLDGSPAESWALVTEPYLDQQQSLDLMRLAFDVMPDWEIDVHVLDKSQSSWNPGKCTPIVATFRPGRWEAFMRAALLWALNGPLG